MLISLVYLAFGEQGKSAETGVLLELKEEKSRAGGGGVLLCRRVGVEGREGQCEQQRCGWR